MRILLGNTAPHQAVTDAAGNRSFHAIEGGPRVTEINIPEGDGGYNHDRGDHTAETLGRHLLTNRDVTRLGEGLEPFLAVCHPDNGHWAHQSQRSPGFVWSDNEDFGRLVADFHSAPFGIPSDVHQTHILGSVRIDPDLAKMSAIAEDLGGATMMAKVNTGQDIQANEMGGGQVGFTGTAGSGGSAPTATTLTDSGAPGWTTNAYTGKRVVAGAVWGIVQSNTATVLTVDRWYTPGTPGGAAGTTPGGGATYVICDGAPPAWFMGLTANNAATVGTDTQLPGEIVTGGGGLVRKICTWAHSAGVNSWTLTAVYTANGSDSLPVTIAKIGVFNSMVVASTISMLFETLYTTTATLSASGDQLTSVDAVTA